jgi:polyhydroxyalkanoate synthesis regulator phasin
MNKVTLLAFKDEMEKICSKEKISVDLSMLADMANQGMNWVAHNPGATAAAAMAKVNLLNRYGQHVPVVRNVMGKLYQGAGHAGLSAGLAGEKMISAPARFMASAVDANTPNMYERAHQVGQALRAKGITSAEQARAHLSDISELAKATGVHIPEQHQAFAKSMTESTPFNRFARAASGPIQNFRKNLKG